MSTAWTGGSTRRWRRLRALVLARDGYLCQLRLPGCTTTAPLQGGHVHHTRGKAAGDDPAHLTAACAHCNQAAGDPTSGRRADPTARPSTKWR